MSYCIKDGYVHRESAVQDFEHEQLMQDGWQDEVYVTAMRVAFGKVLGSVLDLGTGSGFKLIHDVRPSN